MNIVVTPDSSWSTTKIIDVADQIMDYRGRTPGKLGMDWGNGTIPAISARNVRMGWIDFSQDFYVGSEALYKRWMTHGDMEQGDILITTEAPLGNVAAVPDSRRYILSQRTILIRPRADLFDKTYVLKFLQSPTFQRLLSENATGSTALGIQRKRLEQLVVWAPGLAIQRRIGEALQDADHLISMLERLIAKKNAIKQGMMQQLLTGNTRLPGFTEDWSVHAFEEMAAPVKDRANTRTMALDTRLIELEHIGSSTGRLTGSAIAGSAVSLKTVFRRGDVLFGKLRAYLRKYWLAEFDGICSTEIWALRAKPAAALSAYIRYLVETDKFITAASEGYGTHMPRSDWSVLRGIEFALPGLDEQAAIAQALSDVDTEISLLHARLAKVIAIKQGMMEELLTGRTLLVPAESNA